MSQITKVLTTQDRRLWAIARPLVFKYFIADLAIRQRKDIVKGMSEHINSILEKHYAALSEAEQKELLKQYEQIKTQNT